MYYKLTLLLHNQQACMEQVFNITHFTPLLGEVFLRWKKWESKKFDPAHVRSASAKNQTIELKQDQGVSIHDQQQLSMCPVWFKGSSLRKKRGEKKEKVNVYNHNLKFKDIVLNI